MREKTRSCPSCRDNRGKAILVFVKEQNYRVFLSIRDEFRDLVAKMTESTPWLADIQDALRIECGYDDYRIETPIVFNRDLNGVGQADNPQFILVADNPGKKEQLAINQRYLVGQSGKLASGWFDRELGINFRSRVIILNKTPVHTPKTAELRKLYVIAGSRRKELENMIGESQRVMAGLAFRLQASLGCPLWISGYGELGPRGLFRTYAQELARLYSNAPDSQRNSLWLFRHFSMNQFSIEIRQKSTQKPIQSSYSTSLDGIEKNSIMIETLRRVGTENRTRILGF